MTKELLPGLGSGALREALAELFELVESGELVRDISRDGNADWMPRMLNLTRVLKKAQDALALSLSSPIEPTSVEHGVTVDYVAGQEREAASARLVARERGYTIPDDWTSQEVIRHITGWPVRPTAQASSGIREALDVGKLAVRLAFYIWEISPVGSIGRVELASYIRKEIESALAPSRQGAGGK